MTPATVTAAVLTVTAHALLVVGLGLAYVVARLLDLSDRVEGL